MAPFYAYDNDSTASVGYNAPLVLTTPWTTVANVSLVFACPPRLRLPPPSPTVRRGALPIRPRRPHAVARVEAVRRGRTEARPSRALRQRRRRARARA